MAICGGLKRTGWPRVLRILNLVLGLARFAAAILLLYLALNWRSPLFASTRSPALVLSIALPLALIGVEILFWRISARWRPATLVYGATALVALLALAFTLTFELQFRWIRSEVLRADPAQIEKLGRHLIVGYRTEAGLRDLIERRAVAGVFITAHNVRGKDADTIRRDIEAVQAIRRAQGLPPLLVATDQEGGGVSRMSPPLPRPVTLGEIVRSHSDWNARREAVRAYAADVGRSLVGARHQSELRAGGRSRSRRESIRTTATPASARAPSRPIRKSSPTSRANIAAGSRGTACIARSSIFPDSAACSRTRISNTPRWRRRPKSSQKATGCHSSDLMQQKSMFTMLAHVRLAAIDRDRPASVVRAGGLGPASAGLEV